MRWWLPLVLMVAALVRVIGLGTESYWFDEIWAVQQVHDSLTGMVSAMSRTDVHPPLYPVILWGWVGLFGESEWVTRLLSAIFGWGAVWVTYLLGRHFYNEKTGVLAAAILSVQGFAVFYSQEARAYSLLLLLGLTSIWFLGTRRRVAYTVTGIFLAYSHVYGLFLLLGHAAYVWFKQPDERRAMVVPFLVIGLAFLPWLPSLLNQVGRVEQDFWIEPIQWVDPIKWCWHWAGFSVWVMIPMLLLVIRGAFDHHQERGLLLFSVAFPVLLPVCISLVSQPIFQAKYPIFIIGPFVLWSARGLLRIATEYRLYGVVAFLALLSVELVVRVHVPVNKEQWRELAEVAREADKAGTVVAAEAYNKPYLPYYLDDVSVHWLEGDAPLETVSGQKLMYLMVHPHHTKREADLDAQFKRVGTKELFRARAAIYQM